MTDALTRRQVLIGGAVLMLTGCVEPTSTTRAPRQTPAGPGIPPFDLGPAPALEPAGLWYQVQPGDSLPAIAARSGVGLQAIIDANHLQGPELTNGQQLWLPGAGAMAMAAPAGPAPGVAEEPPQVSSGGYVMVPRSAWAVAGVRGNNLPMNGVTRITIHHTGEEHVDSVSELELLRRIEHFHQTSRNWSAIGYHYLVGRTGNVYEGRPVHYQGAHVKYQNEHNLGISVIGDFMHVMPAPAQLAALGHFLEDQRGRFHVGKHRVYGHRELGVSECPGDRLFSWVQRYRTLAA